MHEHDTDRGNWPGITPDDVPADGQARHELAVRLAKARQNLARIEAFWTDLANRAHHAAEHRDDHLMRVPAGYVGNVSLDSAVPSQARRIGGYRSWGGDAPLVNDELARSLTENAERTAVRAYAIAGAARRELDRLTAEIPIAFGPGWERELAEALTMHLHAETDGNVPAGTNDAQVIALDWGNDEPED